MRVTASWIPAEWRAGEVAVLGLAKSGRAAAALLAREGVRVYASDSGDGEAARRAAEALAADGAEVQLGGHDLGRISRVAVVIASPGIPPEAPPIAAALAAGVPVVGELEVGLRAMPMLRYVAVTGSNGKTTTTALVAHLMRALGLDAVEAGNIGTPLAQLALREPQPAWAALEISSFQLHDTPAIAPTVGVVTNLSPNHLDRYASLDDYYGDKALIFRNASPGSRWVLNADDEEVMRLHERLPGVEPGGELAGDVRTFSLVRSDSAAWYDRDAGMLMLHGEPLLPRAELGLVGDHNVANALCAALAVSEADPAHRTPEARRRLADALRVFGALEHRIEPVAEVDGVQWINDSKSTSVAATLVALQGMVRPTVLLLGGRHKGEPYTVLADEARRTVRAVVAYGESGPIVEQDLGGMVPVERVTGSFDEVIARARALARPGDAVLLSPACSSYDMFDNYEQRGATFKRLAAGRAAAVA